MVMWVRGTGYGKRDIGAEKLREKLCRFESWSMERHVGVFYGCFI